MKRLRCRKLGLRIVAVTAIGVFLGVQAGCSPKDDAPNGKGYYEGPLNGKKPGNGPGKDSK